jgi:hypothetical protein
VSGPRCRLGHNPAELVQDEDPNDLEVVLRDLPERERAQFLRQYQTVVDVAHDPAGYRQLQRLLHAWRLTVIATSRVGYYDEIDAVRDGTAQTVAAEEVILGWQEQLAAARTSCGDLPGRVKPAGSRTARRLPGEGV